MALFTLHLDAFDLVFNEYLTIIRHQVLKRQKETKMTSNDDNSPSGPASSNVNIWPPAMAQDEFHASTDP